MANVLAFSRFKMHAVSVFANFMKLFSRYRERS
jgi:hypothetical protein